MNDDHTIARAAKRRTRERVNYLLYVLSSGSGLRADFTATLAAIFGGVRRAPGIAWGIMPTLTQSPVQTFPVSFDERILLDGRPQSLAATLRRIVARRTGGGRHPAVITMVRHLTTAEVAELDLTPANGAWLEVRGECGYD